MARIKLTAAQKEEIRRLTQKANRRIKAAERAYAQAGKTIVPREIVGDVQQRRQWHTRATPLSRSVVFESDKAYREHLRYLRSFEHQRPGIREFTNIQREKTQIAMESALGMDVPSDILRKMDSMTAPELSNFWNRFSENASRMGIAYSSDAVMQQTLAEFFPEDIENVIRE